MLRAAYDRVFQPAPLENILLSTAAAGLDIEGVEDGVPVPASRGHFFEAGFHKNIRNRLRIDGTHFWRRFRNYSDDDVFFNTGRGVESTPRRIIPHGWQRTCSARGADRLCTRDMSATQTCSPGYCVPSA